MYSFIHEIQKKYFGVPSFLLPKEKKYSRKHTLQHIFFIFTFVLIYKMFQNLMNLRCRNYFK
ncbi:hypothetical protein Echvi_1227 [Echinicola vietnamensis DSM 17526]|uniref:Uncharacterized protein n=1 Tax=Echinicola vietnamensis (strain DSM 17526 / LMG 23754 / KMM 6221) TaxID=926556 RepID=L0FWV9_ECHVK|nr:hypothetical protein Echvi_1227 [Echinicola vietnamensis DSM 17526]